MCSSNTEAVYSSRNCFVDDLVVIFNYTRKQIRWTAWFIGVRRESTEGEKGVHNLSRSRFVCPWFGYNNPLLSSLLKTVGVVLGCSEGERDEAASPHILSDFRSMQPEPKAEEGFVCKCRIPLVYMCFAKR